MRFNPLALIILTSFATFAASSESAASSELVYFSIGNSKGSSYRRLGSADLGEAANLLVAVEDGHEEVFQLQGGIATSIHGGVESYLGISGHDLAVDPAVSPMRFSFTDDTLEPENFYLCEVSTGSTTARFITLNDKKDGHCEAVRITKHYLTAKPEHSAEVSADVVKRSLPEITSINSGVDETGYVVWCPENITITMNACSGNVCGPQMVIISQPTTLTVTEPCPNAFFVSSSSAVRDTAYSPQHASDTASVYRYEADGTTAGLGVASVAGIAVLFALWL